ncbi:MAG TPA: TAXI family TRAP transporter solute-binding subunit [Kofleriaceae bacterium]|nr:TAXI family TRAP transporter solute-binding subunit [Kofleriaceae bacterium]
MRATESRRFRRPRLPGKLVTVSWRDLLIVVVPVALVIVGAIWAAVALVRPAPPDTIRFLGGPDGSSYRNSANKYKAIIERHGVKVEIVTSRGSVDNLQQLAGNANVDVGFVQSGLTEGVDISGLRSLGSVLAQPLMVYYRNDEPLDMLSQLRGMRLAVGPVGSGTRALALALLKGNDIEGSPTVLVDLGGEEAAQALTAGKVDAAFLMGDSATPKIMRRLREVPGIELMNFRQAAGYVRRFRFLTRLTLPEGAQDLGRNLPPKPYELVGPTVELVAGEDLHPALSDLLISAAREVHSGPGMFRDAGMYPSAQERDFPISDDAERYYKSGGQFLYRNLPFWLASLVDRMLVVIVPLLVLIVPATKLAPTLYRWRVRSRIYRWYGALMAIERDILQAPTSEAREEMREKIHARLDEIEDAVNTIKTPLSFADQLYVLREHVSMVRRRLEAGHHPR